MTHKKRKDIMVWVSRDRGLTQSGHVQFWRQQPHRIEPKGWFDGVGKISDEIWDYAFAAFRLLKIRVPQGQVRAFRITEEKP